MTELSNWIAGLMRHNYEAVGFIPEPTLRHQYIAQSRYILQCDERGRPVGYLLHGALQCGRPAIVSQHCIELDKRMRGYGQAAVQTLIERCEHVGATSIRLRCAEDLPAVQFWQSCGFRVQSVVPGGEKRQRMIVQMVLPLALPLFQEVAA